MTLQCFYTTQELSVIFNRKYNATRRLLKNMNIPSQKIGKSIVFMISDIKEAAPSLYASMVETMIYNDQVEID